MGLDRWYFNRFTVTGAILIITGVLIYEVEALHSITTSIFYPLLLGSSEGKLVLFLFSMGGLLILNTIISSGKITSKFAGMDISGSRKYLKYTIILVLITFLIGILIEIWLRLNFGVSLFTVFVSLNPDVSSTSIMHSHIFKSALGSIFSNLGTVLPSNIHTGDSLFGYISPLAYIIIFTLPLTYITSLISMDNRMGHYRVIIAFAASLAMIGMIDGGMFSNPAIIGFAGLIGMYFIKEPFSSRDLIKPSLVVLLIILAGLAIEIGGSNPDNHQITLINQTGPVNWNGFNVQDNGNNTYTLFYNQNDKNNLIKLFSTVKGKADAFFITWDFYSYY